VFDTCHRKLRRLAKDARSYQKKWGRQLLVGEIRVRGARISEFYVFLKLCHKYLFELLPFSLISFRSHATSCAPCAKAKAACKPFDADKARAKARAETARRSKARRAKQQTNAEWKAEVLRKLDGLGELRGLRKDVRRIAVALEKLAGIEGQNSDKELLARLESEGDITEVQGDKEKRKQSEERLDREDKKEMGRQEEDNEMEGVEEGDGGFSPVAYSVGTGV